jgi:hypothetical protein
VSVGCTLKLVVVWCCRGMVAWGWVGGFGKVHLWPWLDQGWMRARDTKAKGNWQTHHPCSVNVLGMMLATHQAPQSTLSPAMGTLTAHYAYMQTSRPRHVVQQQLCLVQCYFRGAWFTVSWVGGTLELFALHVAHMQQGSHYSVRL